MSEKLQFSIYKLSEDVWEEKNDKPFRPVKISDDFLKRTLKKKGFRPQQVQISSLGGYELSLFYSEARGEAKWKEFISAVASNGSDILKDNRTRTESYVLIMKNSKSGQYFAVTGGFGFLGLNRMIDQSFGLEVLARLLKDDERSIKSAKEKNITGSILGTTKYFRKDYTLRENESFANFYDELQVQFDVHRVMSTFNLTANDVKKACLCVAKNSFTLKKSVNFNQLITVVNNCESLLKKRKVAEINSVVKLDKKLDNILISALDSQVRQKLIDYFSGKTTDLHMDLANRDNRYFEATSFIISSGEDTLEIESSLRNVQQLKKAITNEYTIDSEDEAEEIVDTISITSVDSDDNIITDGLLFEHLFVEEEYKSKTYFNITGDWYEVRPAFIKRLNDQCSHFISGNPYSRISKKWPTAMKENAYNSQYFGSTDTLVFDKIV